MTTPIGVTGTPPTVESGILANLILDLYPFEQVQAVKPLPSYDDRNYYLRATMEEKGEEDPGEEFVAKIFNSAMSDQAAIDGLNSILVHLNQKALTGIASPVLSRAGNEVERVSMGRLTSSKSVESDEGEGFFLRLVTYIPGEMLDRIDKVYVTPQLLYDVGAYAARIDSLMKDFSHPGVEGRFFPDWDLTHFLTLRRFLPTITDQKKKSMFETVLGYFEKHVSPNIPLFSTGVIHADLNGLNIVVKRENSRYTMGGVIDFSDCAHACYIFELGILVGYTMVDNADPIPLVGPMINGYLDIFPLPEAELDCLYYVVLARMCQSGVLGDHQFTLQPWNTYLLTTPAKAWRLIENLLSTTKEVVDRIWKEARKKRLSNV